MLDGVDVRGFVTGLGYPSGRVAMRLGGEPEDDHDEGDLQVPHPHALNDSTNAVQSTPDGTARSAVLSPNTSAARTPKPRMSRLPVVGVPPPTSSWATWPPGWAMATCPGWSPWWPRSGCSAA